MFNKYLKRAIRFLFKNKNAQVAKGNNIIQVGRNLIVKSLEDIQAHFDTSANLINNGEPRPAQVLLENLWKLHNDKMTSRQKSNCKRLIGCSFDNQDKSEQAGKCFLEAKDYDPEWEKARAFESLGYLCLGRSSKAHELAEEVLKDFSQNNIAWSVWIRTVNNLSLDQILTKVPPHLHNDVEVAMALAIISANEKNYTLAEKYLQIASKEVPGNPRIAEKLAHMLLERANIDDIFLYQRHPSQEETIFLEKAVELFTEAINKFQKEAKVYFAANALIKRASAFKALSKNKEARDDLEQAYSLAQDNPEIVYWHSVELGQEDLDEAIIRLKKITNTSERSDVEFLLAQMLKQRSTGTDLHDAVNILGNRIKDMTKMPCDFRVDYLSLLFQIRAEIENFEQIKQDFNNITSDIIDEFPKNILWAEVLWFCNDIPNAIKQAKECLKEIEENTNIYDKRRLAVLLQNLGLHKEALKIWKSIVVPQYIGRDTYNLMECAQRCEDAKCVIEFSGQLRANGVWDKRIFELELHCHELFNDDEGATALLQEYLVNPFDESYVPYARARLSLIGIRKKQNDLIEKDPLKLPEVKEVNVRTGRLVVTVLRYGNNHNEALEYAYNLLRLNLDNSEAHITMMEVLLPIGPNISIIQPDSVMPGTAVYYKKDDTDVCRWHIIEDSNLGVLVQDRNEYAIDHLVSQAMLGKKCGDTFFLREDGIQNRSATIQKIRSKYVYRYNECFENYENRFPSSNVIRKFIGIDKSGKFDITPFQKLAERDAEYVQRLEELYSSQPLSLYSMAIKKGRSVIETMNYIAASPSLELKCCIGNDQEEIDAEECMSTATEIVLDASAIATLLFTQSYKHIVKMPYKFIVSEGTLNTIRQAEILHGDPESKAGSYSIEGFHVTTPEDVMKARSSLENLLSFLKQSCTVIDGLVVAELEKEERDKYIDLLGRDCLESILLATQSKRILWTDDWPTTMLAQNRFGCYRIWTQFFFNYSSEKGVLDNNIVQDITVMLMQMGYYYTKPAIDTFMVAIEKSDGDINKAPAFQVFNWFSNPNVKPQGQFYITSNVIKRVWQETKLDSIAQQITIRILERLAQRPNGHFVIEGLNNNIRQIFGLDVINGEKAKTTIQSWLLGTQRNRLILP